jgi:hypothetical protein
LLERVLALLEERFPWLGSGRDEPVAGSGSIDVRSDPDQPATQERDKERPDDGDPES